MMRHSACGRLPLAMLLGVGPRVERAEGTLSGRLRLRGAVAAPQYQGGFELNDGEVALHGLATPISDIGLALAIDGNEVNIVRGSAARDSSCGRANSLRRILRVRHAAQDPRAQCEAAPDE